MRWWLAAAVCWGALGVIACGGKPATALPSVTTTTSNLGPATPSRSASTASPISRANIASPRDGSINFPLVGRIEVAGRGAAEIAKLIETALLDRKLLREPNVSVFLLEQTSAQVSVVGAVYQAGQLIRSPRGSTSSRRSAPPGGLTSLASGDNRS